MTDETEFCLLGPLLVRRGDRMLRVAPGRQRALLAALLLRAGRVVPVDDLTEVLWGALPPPSARSSLQNYVMRLRRSLAETGPGRIGTEPDGYLITVGRGELDVHRFESGISRAREATRSGSWADAAGLLRTALALWRGQPLSGVPSDTLALREIPRLAEMRLQALEAWLYADLHLGLHAEAIAELRQLAAAHPLRERLHVLLMIALYRDGQQASALAAYQAVREDLVSELGVEPGFELRELQRRILAAVPAHDVLDLAVPARDRDSRAVRSALTAGKPSAPVMPRQLPCAAGEFTGRAAELAALTHLADSALAAKRTMLTAVVGTAGVGKTALAVHWAHQVAGRFPDGQLYVDLRGYDPGERQEPADVLAGFLRELGVAEPDIPAELTECATRYRSILAGRRMLVVLDNAGSVEQVRSLVPAAPGCATLVTSRDALAGLVARDGAGRLELGPLPLPDSVRLLRVLIGSRAAASPGETAALASRCACLPLALRVAAELAVSLPAASLAELAGELDDQQRRLDLLDAAGDSRTAVRAVFSWSYQHLDDEQAHVFRLLGLHPGPELDRYAVAALAATTAERAGRVLSRLARAHLVHINRPERYGMHDLLRTYAAEQVARRDAEPALTRLFDYYLGAAGAAMDALFAAERHHRPRIPPGDSAVPVMADPAAARAWLDTERANLIAMAAHAANSRRPRHAIAIAATLFRYLNAGAHHLEAVTAHTYARDAARQVGDRAAEATALINLGISDVWLGRADHATRHLRQAVTLCRQVGDRAGEARALGNLGCLDQRQGRYSRATRRLQRALVLFREVGDRTGMASALGNLGDVCRRQGRYRQAAGYLQQTLLMCAETGDLASHAYALVNLGDVDRRRGRYDQAAGYLELALAMSRETGNRACEGYALMSLGDVNRRQGHHQQAASQLAGALALFREIRDRSGEAETLSHLGEVYLARGDPPRARVRYDSAIAIAIRVGDEEQQARALNGLGLTCQAAGDLVAACSAWQQALAVYTGLKAPEADQIRAQLETINGQPAPARRSGPGRR